MATEWRTPSRIEDITDVVSMLREYYLTGDIEGSIFTKQRTRPHCEDITGFASKLKKHYLSGQSKVITPTKPGVSTTQWR
jgi:hypothetical protein